MVSSEIALGLSSILFALFQGYEDEPISKILANIGESDTVLLDRWELSVVPNTAAAGEDTSNAKPELPLNVVNNYFSFGVDAHIALEFHEARGKLLIIVIPDTE